MKRIVPALVVSSLSVVLASCGGPESPGDELCYSVMTQALDRVCEGPQTVPGIDVSYYQGSINFSQVKGAGTQFVIARVSDGLNYPDSKFATYWPAIHTQGMVRGTYQFFRPGQDALAQANLVLSKVQAAGGFRPDDLPVVLDIEATDNQPSAVVRQKMQIWLDRIEQATGKKPIIYTAAFMSSVIGNGFSSYPLWVANYGATCPAMPSNWTAWKFWQHSSTGSVAGISGNVDMDKWNGTLAQLKAYASPPVVDAGTPDAGAPDAGHADAGIPDAGAADAGAPDAGTVDAGADAGADDAGEVDAGEIGEPPQDDAGVLPDGGAWEGATIGMGKLEFIEQCGVAP